MRGPPSLPRISFPSCVWPSCLQIKLQDGQRITRRALSRSLGLPWFWSFQISACLHLAKKIQNKIHKLDRKLDLTTNIQTLKCKKNCFILELRPLRHITQCVTYFRLQTTKRTSVEKTYTKCVCIRIYMAHLPAFCSLHSTSPRGNKWHNNTELGGLSPRKAEAVITVKIHWGGRRRKGWSHFLRVLT